MLFLCNDIESDIQYLLKIKPLGNTALETKLCCCCMLQFTKKITINQNHKCCLLPYVHSILHDCHVRLALG